MTSEHSLTERIHSAMPDLRVESVRRVPSGQYNDVLVVNEALVFRFPRFAEAARRLEMEAALLKGVAPYLSLPVPIPVAANLGAYREAERFLAYRLLPGEPFSGSVLAAVHDAATLDRLAGQLVAFLRGLHAVPVQAVPTPLPLPDLPANWRELAHRMEVRLYPRMSSAQRGRARAHFALLTQAPRAFDVPLTLVHGDFGGSNILFDRRTNAITGVLDFGEAGLNDPALDFAPLLNYGEPYFARVLAQAPEIEPWLPRIRFYHGTFALQEALYGVEHDDPEALARGLAGYA